MKKIFDKKIAIFHPYLNDYCLGGGGENLIFKMCENLKADLWIGSIDFKSWGKDSIKHNDFVKQLWNKNFKFYFLHKEFFFYNSKLFFLTHIFKLISFAKRFFFLKFSPLIKKMDEYDLVIFSYGNTFFLPQRLKKCKKVIYMHSPIRKLFDQFKPFLDSQPLLLKPIYLFIRFTTKVIFLKDLKSVDKIIVNSQNIKKRLKKYLNVSADEVIFPGLETKNFVYRQQKDFFLSYGRLDTFKRIEIIIDAFSEMPNKKLIVCSHGPLVKKIKEKCSSCKNIDFLGKVSNQKLKQLIGNCIAGIYIPIDEDAGITQLEIMSAGKPIIGVRDGGLVETVIDKKTGFLLPKRITKNDIIETLKKINKKEFLNMKKDCQKQGRKYDYFYFYEKLNGVIKSLF